MNTEKTSTPHGPTPFKRQLIAIAAIVALGAGMAAWILLGSGKSAAAGDEHGHEQHSEAKDHADGEHHGNKPAEAHAHDKGHADGEHHEKAAAAAPHEDEGLVALNDAQARAAGITLATSGAARIQSSLQMPGEIRFNEDRTAHVVPRVAGVIESVPASLGQQVRKGQLLAVVASATVSELRSELLASQKRLGLARNTFEREKKLWEDKISAEQDYLQAQQALREAEINAANAQNKLGALGAPAGNGNALSRYELRAPFDGVIVEKHVALGESVKEDTQVFIISDLSSVCAELSVPAKDLPLLRVGETVRVKASAFDSSASGKVAYVGALVGEQTRTARARVTLPNPQGVWRPGLFVNVAVTASEAEVPVSVATEAIQTVEGKPVVFIKVNGGFKAQPVETGRSDGRLTEVLKGLPAGATYAAAGSFVLKSELGKASAEHSH